MNLPNKLTLIRIILIPVFVAVFYLEVIPFNFVVAAAIFAIAAFTDYLDGHIARKYNLVTDLGKFLDPIADKVLVSTAFIVLLSPIGIVAYLPFYAGICVAVILARELIVSGFRMVAASKGIVLAADKSGKIKTFVQDIAIVTLLVSLNFNPSDILYISGLIILGIATVLTIVSGAECIIKNSSVIKSK